MTGAQADGEALLSRARRTLITAGEIVERDPDSAFVLAYDAARYAGTALLAQQGLRPTSKGGHYALEVALRAQFGPGFRAFGALRRRRNELEYPEVPDEAADLKEAQEAIADAGDLVRAAEELLPRLAMFG